jgi:hypothetical protein
MNVLLLIAIAFFIYYVFIKKKEKFETNESVILQTKDGEFFSICNDKHLCLVKSESDAKTFSIMKFSDDLLALENQGYYITSCFGENCTDMIKVDSFNPYAPNAKLKLITNGDHYNIELYDGQFFGKNSDNHVVRIKDKESALNIKF